MYKGMSRSTLYTWAAITFLASCVFEMYGINGGAYEYYGPHALRVFGYPLVIGVLETAQVVCFSWAATELRKRMTGPSASLLLFVLFPCVFYFANFGAGAPTIIALHLADPSPGIVAAASTVSIVFAISLIWMVAHAQAQTVAGRNALDARVAGHA